MIPFLLCEGVSCRFGGVHALADVSFEMKQGEILGLIGPNGAGKTTLLNCICQMARPSAGEITFKGRPLVGVSPSRLPELGIARTFQIVRPFRNMTVLDNAVVSGMFGRHRMASGPARKHAYDILEFTGIAHRAGNRSDQIPIPEQKRLEVARALCMDPELLLLDEVMAGLNPTGVDTMLGLIRKVRDRGVTILIIEHLMRAIMGVCDRVLVLHEGRVLALDTPDRIANDTRVISAYLGSRFGQKTAGGLGHA